AKQCAPRILIAALLSATVQAQSAPVGIASGSVRTRVTINDGWKYRPDGLNLAERPAMPDSDWQRVNLPHTWNVTDPFDDSPSYRRGIGWYRKRLTLDEKLRGKRIFLHFEGVNQVAEVFVNGAFAGGHKGGYSAFTVDITDEVKYGGGSNENVVAIKVDNSHSPFIAPLSVGFALYGGIYRDVWLIATDPVHITMMDHGSSGVFLTTPGVSATSGPLRARGSIVNESASPRQLRIVNTLLDVRRKPVAEQSSTVLAPVGRETRWEQSLPSVRAPRLWSPSDPYLYTVRTEVYEGSVLRDRVENRIGFRWFAFDAQRGFSLNGKKLTLRGTNRHQDRDGLGSALSNEQHLHDLRSIKEMGANFLRLAHYPQDPAVLAAADSLGLLIWEEIPVVNYITPAAEFTHNSEVMLREMIRQHYNHPSVVMWGTMNEVFLWSPQGFRIRNQIDTAYMSRTREYAQRLDSVARNEDPARVTTMAVHGSGDYDGSGVARVSQVVGQNIYSGWYGGVFDDLGKQLDRRHTANPAEVVFVSEYGAEDDYRVESLEPERFDFSGTWMRRFHESYIRQFNARPWLAGTAIWSQFDFSQPETGGSIPYMNQKGMERWNRIRKDVFYLYKANWNPAPMAYIASRGWPRRTGTTAASSTGMVSPAVPQPVDVYSNLERIELFANGRSLGVKTPDDVRRATWDVPFVNGRNRL
ncbi:MAG: glycoside hydrolase family 2 protein, partial [Solirubrobacterales bacterium]|nr:glycoside hydrolase family 2 protein [Solirubrobacterales bacterium]